jgi:maleylacetoacetate isomerase
VSEFVLYSYFRSSASFRVRIALGLKDIKYDYRAVHLLKGGGEQFKDDYAKLNPSRQVPTLVHDGVAIGQSMAIIDYLDAIQPTPHLFPKDPLKRALVTQACEIVNSGAQPFGNTSTMTYLRDVLKLDDGARKAWVAHWLSNGSRTLENLLSKQAGDFAFANEVTAADCFVLPHLFSCERFGAPYDDCPTLLRLKKTYMNGEAFKRAMPDQQPDYEA